LGDERKNFKMAKNYANVQNYKKRVEEQSPALSVFLCIIHHLNQIFSYLKMFVSGQKIFQSGEIFGDVKQDGL